jgi:hypothetical protein
VHNKGEFSVDGSHSRIGLMIMRQGIGLSPNEVSLLASIETSLLPRIQEKLATVPLTQPTSKSLLLFHLRS